MINTSISPKIFQPGKVEATDNQPLLGLTQSEAQKLLQQLGPNAIPEQKIPWVSVYYTISLI